MPCSTRPRRCSSTPRSHGQRGGSGGGSRARQGHGLPLLPEQGGDAARAARTARRALLRRPHAPAQRQGTGGFDEVWPVTRDNLVRAPGYLPLTSRCFGLMDRDMPASAALAFKINVAEPSPPPAPGSSDTSPRLAGRRHHPDAAQLRPHRGALAADPPHRALRHRDAARRTRHVQARLRARGRTGAARPVGRIHGARAEAPACEGGTR